VAGILGRTRPFGHRDLDVPFTRIPLGTRLQCKTPIYTELVSKISSAKTSGRDAACAGGNPRLGLGLVRSCPSKRTRRCDTRISSRFAWQNAHSAPKGDFPRCSGPRLSLIWLGHNTVSGNTKEAAKSAGNSRLDGEKRSNSHNGTSDLAAFSDLVLFHEKCELNI
jgi:hypothetical protein